MAEQDDILEDEEGELEGDEIANFEEALIRGFHQDVENTRTKTSKEKKKKKPENKENEEEETEFGREFWGEEKEEEF